MNGRKVPLYQDDYGSYLHVIDNNGEHYSHELWPESLGNGEFSVDNLTIILTDSHVFVLFAICYLHSQRKKESLLIVELNTNDFFNVFVSRSDGNEADYYGVADDKERENLSMKINAGKIGIYTMAGSDLAQLFLLDLTLVDAEKVLKGQRILISKATLNGNGCIQLENFIEIRQGLCLFQIEDHSSDLFTLEMMAWKGETLPKALRTWSEQLIKVESMQSEVRIHGLSGKCLI